MLTIAALTLGLEPAKVSVTQCSKTDATWSITAPKTAPFNTPRFNFSALDDSVFGVAKCVTCLMPLTIL